MPVGDQHVCVANPGRYLVQKLLSLLDRQHDKKKAKDAIYVHDTLLLFQQGQALHPEFVSSVHDTVQQLTASQRTRLREVCELLGNGSNRIVVDAVKQLAQAGRTTDPANMSLLYRLGFAELQLAHVGA